jgi:hypothetical protein
LKILQLWTESWKTCFFSVLASLMLWYQFVAHTGPKANTNKTQTQADLRCFPKPGTSTEAADCILMEKWYKHSTQPNTTHKNQCFTLTLFSLKSALALSLTVALTTLLCTLTSCTHTALFLSRSSLLSLVYMRRGSINIVVVKERVVGSGEGSWEWLRKNVDNLQMSTICYNLYLPLPFNFNNQWW